MSAAAYAARRIGKVAAATRRRQQQSSSHHHHRSHPHPAAQRLPELPPGPYNIWNDEEESNYGPMPRKVIHFSSAEERNAYLSEKRAREEAIQHEMDEYWRLRDEEAAQRRAAEEQWRQEAARLAAEQRAAEQAENEETAQMNCIGRTCKRVWQTVKGTHKLNGTRKEKTDGGRRRRRAATRRCRKN